MGRLILMFAFGAILTGFMLAVGVESLSLPQFALSALAAYKLGRIVAKEKIAACFREPFCDNGEPRNCVGELVTCPYCLSLWFAAAFTMGMTVLPAEATFLATIFAIHAITDYLNAGFIYLRERS